MKPNKLEAIIAISLILTSCGPDEHSQEKLKSLGTKASQCHISKVHLDYLGCYALDVKEKTKCVNVLNKKHIIPKWRIKETYTKNFQYTAEKLGFINFLNNKNLPCKTMNEGPVFDKEHNAYEVKCLPENKYFMQFNYKTKEWSVENA